MPVPELGKEARFKLKALKIFMLRKREIQEFQRYLVFEVKMLRQVDAGVTAMPEFAK
jgi:hypothetical protein